MKSARFKVKSTRFHVKSTRNQVKSVTKNHLPGMATPYIGLKLFERPYFMKGRNLTIAKTTDFGGETVRILCMLMDFDWNPQISTKILWNLQNPWNPQNPPISVFFVVFQVKIRGFLCEKKDHFPKKVTHIFLIRIDFREIIQHALYQKGNERK